MQVRFVEDFDWDVPEYNGSVTLARPAGWSGTVKRDHGEAAVKAGKAVALEGETDGTENRRRASSRGADRTV